MREIPAELMAQINQAFVTESGYLHHQLIKRFGSIPEAGKFIQSAIELNELDHSAFAYKLHCEINRQMGARIRSQDTFERSPYGKAFTAAVKTMFDFK